jgi:DNA-directed RNA polymerase subunit RPC12/RpoP
MLSQVVEADAVASIVRVFGKANPESWCLKSSGELQCDSANLSPRRWYASCLNFQVESLSGRDLQFECAYCKTSLIIDSAAAGMSLACQHCGELIRVPPNLAMPLSLEKKAELQRQLRENESQRTEITGYINQLNIQLHRWQLRSQSLNSRNTELKAELAALDPTARST